MPLSYNIPNSNTGHVQQFQHDINNNTGHGSERTSNRETTATTTVSDGTTSSAGRSISISREDADKLYEERIEEEYAKREGGA